MLSFTGGLKVFVALDACDMRKGFNRLYALIIERLGEDPRSGALFVFSNRRRTRLKVLYWDGTGLWVMTKRLEEGTFAWPQKRGAGCFRTQAHSGSLCDAHRRHRLTRGQAAPVV